MMVQKFEVGKSYKGKYSGVIRKCVFVDDDGATLKGSDRSFTIVTSSNCDHYYEVREPVVIKERRLVLIDGNDVFLPTQKSAYGNVIGEIEVVITDGKLTDVRIL
jgi:hypothetical protein